MVTRCFFLLSGHFILQLIFHAKVEVSRSTGSYFYKRKLDFQFTIKTQAIQGLRGIFLLCNCQSPRAMLHHVKTFS